MDRMLVFHVVNLGLIPGNMISWDSLEVIPEQKSRNKPSVLLNVVGPKPKNKDIKSQNNKKATNIIILVLNMNEISQVILFFNKQLLK